MNLVSQVTNPVDQSVANIPMPSEPEPITALSIPSLPPLELSTIVAEEKNNDSPFAKGSEEGEIIDQAEAESSKEDTASSITTPLERSGNSKMLSKDAAMARDQFKHNVCVMLNITASYLLSNRNLCNYIY